MQESSVYQDSIKERWEHIYKRAYKMGFEKGYRIGVKANAIENILVVLEIRFDATATSIKPALEAIDDLQRLKTLLREAVEAETLAAFIDKL